MLQLVKISIETKWVLNHWRDNGCFQKFTSSSDLSLKYNKIQFISTIGISNNKMSKQKDCSCYEFQIVHTPGFRQSKFFYATIPDLPDHSVCKWPKIKVIHFKINRK